MGITGEEEKGKILPKMAYVYGICYQIQKEKSGTNLCHDTTSGKLDANCDARNETWTGRLHAAPLDNGTTSNPTADEHSCGVPALPPTTTRGDSMDSAAYCHAVHGSQLHACTPAPQTAPLHAQMPPANQEEVVGRQVCRMLYHDKDLFPVDVKIEVTVKDLPKGEINKQIVQAQVDRDLNRQLKKSKVERKHKEQGEVAISALSGRELAKHKVFFIHQRWESNPQSLA
ncbi:hypothetical protein FXO38_06814 [Capsicum annuum]|nr:hypothetical protein FXO38_06814 [Capsicum annuum]